MPEEPLFSVEFEQDVMLVVPVRNVSSLSEYGISQELTDILATIRDRCVSKLIVDFQHVDYFGSAMLEVLRKLWTELEDRGRFRLCNLTTMGLEVLHLARFDSLWPIDESRSESLEALEEDGS